MIRCIIALLPLPLLMSFLLSTDDKSKEVELIVDDEIILSSSLDFSYFHQQLAQINPKSPKRNNFQTLSLFSREDLITNISRDYKRTECEAAPIAGDFWDEIKRRAAQTSIVIINESHEQSLHRSFIGQVAEHLKPLGYNIYAAEAFHNNYEGIDPINIDTDVPYFRFNDGGYTREVSFGRLGRLLKDNDFEFIAYEDTRPIAEGEIDQKDPNSEVHRREEGQAKNLMTDIFRDRPNAKVIIHVGYNHARETLDSKKRFWMAGRIKEKTGVDPLTITQVHCKGSGHDMRVSTPPASLLGGFDIAVDHPIATYVRGRPKWRLDNGDILVDIPEKLLPKKGWHVIEARRDNEPIEAVPMDSIAVMAGEDVALSLPPGRYKVRAIKVDF